MYLTMYLYGGAKRLPITTFIQGLRVSVLGKLDDEGSGKCYCELGEAVAGFLDSPGYYEFPY